MRFLLIMAVVISGSSVASIGSTAPVADSVVSLYRQPLLKSVHQMVASGYALYSARLPTIYQTVSDDIEHAIAMEGHLLVPSGGLIDGKPVCCQAVYAGDLHPLHSGKAIRALQTVGIFSQESGMVETSHFTVFAGFTLDGTIWLTGDYSLKQASDDLLRLTATKDDGWSVALGFKRNKNYRVYRGQREIDDGDGNAITVTETITINGHNPYVIYRHTSWEVDEHHTNYELSIGTYPSMAMNPSFVIAKIIETNQGVADGNLRPVSTDISYIFEDDALTERSREGEVLWTIGLQLIEDSDVWLEFEGNIGITGAGLATMLVDQLRSRKNGQELVVTRIADELANELRPSQPLNK